MRNTFRITLVVGILSVAAAFVFVVRSTKPVPYVIPVAVASGRLIDLDGFEALLSRRVDANGAADYAAWRSDAEDRNAVAAFLAFVAKTSPRSDPAAFPSRAAALRYWIHAHTAAQIAVVLETGARDLDLDLPAPWSSVRGDGLLRRRSFQFGGETQTLFGLVRRPLAESAVDPRVVFALGGVAPVFGPPPRTIPADDVGMEDFLARRAAEFFAREDDFSLKPDGSVVRVATRVFYWRDLLTGRKPRAGDSDADGVLLEALATYAPAPIARKLLALPRPRIEAVEADWRVR